MGNLCSPPKTNRQTYKLFSNNPDVIIIIKIMENGYRITSTEYDKSIVVFYENIKKISYDGIHNKGHKHYKKYSLIYKKMDGDYSMIDINISFDVITRSCETNKDAKEIKNIIIDNYELYLLKNKLKINDHIFL